MNAAQIPERDLEITANAVRLIRRAPEGAMAVDIEKALAEITPTAEPDQLRRCLANAGRLLSR